MHVIHHLVIGGMENGLVNLINHLPEAEFRHTVVCVDDHSSFASRIARRDVEVIDLHRKRDGLARMRWRAYQACRAHRPRILHSRGLSGLDALLPSLLAGVPRRIHGEHGWDVGDLDGRAARPLWLRRLHAPLVHHYVTVSQDLRRYMVERVGIRERRVTAICNGVDTDRFQPGPPPADLPLPDSFATPGIVRIGTVGRLQPVKDQATLVDACALLASRRPELRARLRLLVVGDGPLRSALAERVDAAGLDDITLFTGATDRVADWLRAIDVFVLPSLNEGISNTLLEAMASGLPALVTPVGGNVELLSDGVTGHSFPIRDAVALAARIESYLDDMTLRDRQGAAARQRAEQVFSLRAMVDAYGALYRRLAAA